MAQTPVEAEEQSDEQHGLPFFNVSGGTKRLVRVQAGWGRGDEIHSLVIDSAVPPSQAGQQMAVAFEWYVERWGELLQANGEAEVDDE